MKEFLKECRNTLIVSISFLLLFFVIFVYGFDISNSSDLQDLDKISKTESVSEIAIKNLENLNFFRNADLSVDSVSDMDMMKFIFKNLQKDDYKIKDIEPLKIVCQVTDSISFISSNTCKVLVINNDKLNEYKHLLFKYDKDLVYDDFSFEKYECKNDGKKYYCLIVDYDEKKNYKEYSAIDSVYENKNRVVIYEYYLFYRYNYESCVKYYEELYCTEDFEGELPKLEDDIIKKYGVYYRHEFIKDNDKLYLEKSYVVS